MSTDTIRHRVVCVAVLVLTADQLTKTAGTLNVGGAFAPTHNPDYSLGLVAAPTMALILVSAVTLIAAGRYGIRLARAGRLPAWVPGSSSVVRLRISWIASRSERFATSSPRRSSSSTSPTSRFSVV